MYGMAYLHETECGAPCRICEGSWRCDAMCIACNKPFGDHLCPACTKSRLHRFVGFWAALFRSMN